MSRPIVIVGGGFAGAYLARYLERHLPGGWQIVLFSEENFLTFTPMLAEVVGSSIDPRHVVRPLRQLLKRTLCRTAAVTRLDPASRQVEYALPDGRTARQDYEHLVLACGMIVNTNILPGAAAHAFPLKTLGDAIALRNHVLTMLEAAEVETDPGQRHRLLSFAVIGGGFSGVEVAGQIYDLLADSLRFYPSLKRDDLRVEVLHGPAELLPELPGSLGRYARRRMEARGLVVRVQTHAHAVTEEGVRLADGSLVTAGTVVCTIGNTVSPLMASSGLPLQRGRLPTEPDMRVAGHANVWALGDCAVVPNARDGKPSPTLAQFALRQARQLAANVKRVLAGQPTRPFTFRMLGSFAAIGHHNAVGDVLGLRLSGIPAWLMWRTIYLGKMPTLARKVQVAFDWAWELFFPRDVVQLNPRATHRQPRAHYEPGDVVYRRGDRADKFYVIEKGRAGVYLEGRPRPVLTLGPGEYFGEGTLLRGEAREGTVRADEPLDVLTVGRERFEDLTAHLPFLRADLEARADRLESAWKMAQTLLDDPGLAGARVRDAMTAPAPTVPGTTTLAEAVGHFRAEGPAAQVVVDGAGRLLGVCTPDDVADALFAARPPRTPLAEVVSRPVMIAEDRPLAEALRSFLETPARQLVIVAGADPSRPVGLLTAIDALLHCAALQAEPAAGATPAGAAAPQGRP
jgi:NADH dehydrogenase